MEEQPKNFKGKLGHFHQCPVSGAFINKKPNPQAQHQKQIKSLHDRVSQLEQMLQSVLENKKPTKVKESK